MKKVLCVNYLFAEFIPKIQPYISLFLEKQGYIGDFKITTFSGNVASVVVGSSSISVKIPKYILADIKCDRQSIIENYKQERKTAFSLFQSDYPSIADYVFK